MSLIPPDPIQPSAARFDPLLEELLAIVPAERHDTACQLWQRILAAAGAECRQWFDWGEGSSDTDEYGRGYEEGRCAGSRPYEEFLKANALPGTVFDPGLKRH